MEHLATKKKIVRFIFRKEIFPLIFIYLFILIPLTLTLIFVGIKLDNLLKLPILFIFSFPFNFLFFFIFLTIGLIIVFWSYKYIVFQGEGSPCSYFGHTKKLVKNGPYALVRHPSIIGKFLGVLGLGILFRSFSFTFIIAPILLVGSLLDKVLREERILAKIFQKEYIDYKKRVPLIIPRIKNILNLFRKKCQK